MTVFLELARDILGDTRDWGEHANCINKANILEDPQRVEEALTLCLGDGADQPRCPVIDQCHAWVIPLKGRNDPGGVRAGRTEEERTDFRKGRPPGHRHNPNTRKQCRKCKKTKPASEFTRHRRHNDGLSSYCKPCEAIRQANKRTVKEVAA